MNLTDINIEAFKALPFCVFIKDTSFRYQWANHFFLSTAAGLNSVNELIGLSGAQLPWQEYAEEVRQNDNKLKKRFDATNRLHLVAKLAKLYS